MPLANRPISPYVAPSILGVATLFGGASRLDTTGPLFARSFILICLFWLLWQPRQNIRIERPALLLWLAAITLLLVQILPLPYAIWAQMPGREVARGVMAAIGAQPWGAISFTPYRSIDALLALVCGFTAYVYAAQLDPIGRHRLLTTALTLMLISAAIGVVQVTSGPHSPLYLYSVTNRDAAVGFFANANHFASFLCGGILISAYWLEQHRHRAGGISRQQMIAAGAMIALLLIGIVASNSRAGLFLSILALAGGAMLLLSPPQRPIVRWGAGMAACAMLAVALASKNQGFSNVLMAGAGHEQRIDAAPTLIRIAADMAPFGSGIGSFDPIYRSYETREMLGFTYLNQAHNEVLQLAIEAGVAGMLLLIAALIWYARRLRQTWRTTSGDTMATAQARVASLILLCVILHSTVDYPLRTDSYLIYFSMICAMLTPAAPDTASHQSNHKTPEYADV